MTLAVKFEEEPERFIRFEDMYETLGLIGGDVGPPGPQGPPGDGVPAGGTTDQYLRKASNTDYDTEWDTLDASDIQYGNQTVDDEIWDLWFSFGNLGSQMLDKADKYSIADSDFSPTLYAHASGTYFFVNNTLYKALIDISAGDTITTTGTNPNAKQAILADDLANIKESFQVATIAETKRYLGIT